MEYRIHANGLAVLWPDGKIELNGETIDEFETPATQDVKICGTWLKRCARPQAYPNLCITLPEILRNVGTAIQPGAFLVAAEMCGVSFERRRFEWWESGPLLNIAVDWDLAGGRSRPPLFDGANSEMSRRIRDAFMHRGRRTSTNRYLVTTGKSLLGKKLVKALDRVAAPLGVDWTVQDLGCALLGLKRGIESHRDASNFTRWALAR